MVLDKRIQVFLLALLSLAWPVQAAEVTFREASALARTFLMGRGRSVAAQGSLRLSRARLSAVADSTAVSPYYVFNVGAEGGFVIVSGDDRTAPILGYADAGSLCEDALPDGLRYLLDGYARQIREVAARPAAVQAPADAKVRRPVAPLLSSQWNQGAPYNHLCPEITYTENDTEKSERAVTGCVATAMAQVMYYHRWPQEATAALPAYTTRTLNINMPALAATTFDWDAMTAAYGAASTATAETAVATLMQYCGTALQMDYDRSAQGGSSAYNVSIAEMLKRSFGYDGGIAYVQRAHYSYTEWLELIYAELAASRPVVLGGQSAGGGHSFVCDGYDADDYFHINWGWGGSSDGYFRLSALNPYDQGIGGSSTLDGFSYSQDAIVGIRPATASAALPTVLYQEAFQFGASDASGLKEFERASAEDPFTGIQLYYTLWHYTFDETTYDYALQLTDANGTTVVEPQELGKVTLTQFNASQKETKENLSLGSGLPDGTYRLKMVCRTAGSDDYSDCHYATRFQMTATIADNRLTLTAPLVRANGSVALNSISTEGNLTVGYEQTVSVALTAAATADYHGNVFLRVNDKTVMGKEIDLAAGETATVRFAYTPSTAGTHTLKVCAPSASNSLGTLDVTILSSDATNQLDLAFTTSVDNLQDGLLYGDALRLTVTAANPSAEQRYVGQLNCSLRKWTQTDDAWTFEGQVQRQPLEVAREGLTTVAFAFDGLERGALYSARLTYQRPSGTATIADIEQVGYDASLGHGTLQTSAGYALGYADGTTRLFPSAQHIDLSEAADVVFLDMRGLDDAADVVVTPGGNPNCLYLLAADAARPDGLSSYNVVCGSVSEAVRLTDGYDFYSPIDFTAAQVSYTRTFTLAAAATEGWNTLCLPFTVATVSVDDGSADGKRVDWFRSDSDTGKHFWLKTLAGDTDGNVWFDHADALNAYTPYIIAVPGDTWGAAWQMTGKAVTFAATGATIAATPASIPVLSGNRYKFCGTTTAGPLTDAYVLDDAGSTFFLHAESTAAPFRAWFEDAHISSLSLPALAIAASPADGLSPTPRLNALTSPPAVYDLQGRRLPASTGRLPKGFYLIGGRKCLIP